jgi:hypothetical protein
MGALAARAFVASALVALISPPAEGAQHDEHPFVMPGPPQKVIPAPSPWLTGAQLLQQLDPPHDAPGREAMIREAVKYIMGVYDVSESALWCYTDYKLRPRPKQPPDIMRASAIGYLRKQPPNVLRGRAAVLIVQMWQSKWPCPPDGCCPSVADDEGRR